MTNRHITHPSLQRGTVSFAPLYYVSPNEIGFEVPAGLATGNGKITITSNGASQSTNLQVAAVSPGLFTLNAAGLATAYAIRVSSGSQIAESVFTVNSAGALVANPISLGSGANQTYLVLFGTGLQAAGSATVGLRRV